MGGGASKNNNNVTSATETKNKNNTETNNYNNRAYGPKNGELAPLPFIASSSTPNNMNNFSSGNNTTTNNNNNNNNSINNIYTRPTWNDSVPLQPIGGNTKKTIPREETPVVPISVIPTPLEPKPKVSSSPSLSSSPLSKPISSLSISSSPTHLNTTPDLVIRGSSSPISPPPSQPFLSSSPSPSPSISPEPRSISPPPAPPSTATQPTRSISPPLSNIDPFKNKHNLLERKLSEGINSPITRFKHTLAGSSEKFSSHEDDQVLVDDNNDNDEDDEDTTKEKSSADKYYENFAVDKPRVPPTKQSSYYSNNSGMNTPLSGFKRQLQHASSVTFHLSDSEDGSDNEHENDNSNNNGNQQNTDERATTAELGTSRKNIPVPSLKLNEIGAKKPAAIIAKPVASEVVAPIPKQHGNFDNDKFRAANAKKKVVDSMFKQTTYDYKAQKKSSPTSVSTRSSSSDPMTCSDRSSIVSSSSSYSSSSRPDTYDSSSLGYSSDNSQDSPNFVRPPNTPHNKPAYDDYEESLISSILNEPKTPA